MAVVKKRPEDAALFGKGARHCDRCLGGPGQRWVWTSSAYVDGWSCATPKAAPLFPVP